MLPATTTFSNPDPGFCPTTFTQLVGNLNSLVTTTVDGTFTPYLVQDATPAVDEQAYIWFKTVSGKPKGIYKFYGGIWRKVWNNCVGDVKMFIGNPSGHFNANGTGLPGGDHDGWQVCNGYNGAENFNDLFPIGAHVNPNGATTGWNGTDWETHIRGTTSVNGGEEQVTLDDTNTYRPARDAVTLYEWDSNDGSSPTPGGGLFGEVTTPGSAVTLLAADAGNPTPDPFWIIPPYKAVCMLQFVGY